MSHLTENQVFNLVSGSAATGQSTYDMWKNIEGNEDKSVEDFLNYLKDDGESNVSEETLAQIEQNKNDISELQETIVYLPTTEDMEMHVAEAIAKAQLEGAGVDTTNFVMQSDLKKVRDVVCDEIRIESENYNLLKTSEVQYLTRLQDNSIEPTSTTNNMLAITGWMPVELGKYYAFSVLQNGARTRSVTVDDSGVGATVCHRMNVKKSDGTIVAGQRNVLSADVFTSSTILIPESSDIIAVQAQLNFNSDISTVDKFRVFEPMFVAGNTMEEAQSNAVNLPYIDGDEVQTKVDYTLKHDNTKADKKAVESIDVRVSNLEGKEVNLFSFEKADTNIAQFSKNSPELNYVYLQNESLGQKDVSNGRFNFSENVFGKHTGITGGLENPLPVGVYKLSAEVYIPSGYTTRTTLRFGAYIGPSVFDNYAVFDIGVQDAWVEVERTFTVLEGDTANYIYASCYMEAYPFYVRNIRVVHLNPKLIGFGKKWVAIGDSITEKNVKTLKNYHDYIAERTGITVVNMGIGGSGYKSDEEGNNAFYQRISNVPLDADVVTIFGSGNDLGGSYTLGDVTDTGTDTLCGCINTTIDNLYSVLPTVQLGIITPNPWGAYNPSNDNNLMAQYSAKMVEICRLRSIPCLDLYHCSGLRPWDSTFLELAYPMNKEGTARDTIHPNELGHSIIASRIKTFLESLIL